MKWSFLLFSSLLCLQAFAQYPATGNKARLGWQTTGDGLVYRGAIGDTTTLDPSGLNNAWMLLDTASGNLYAYRAKAWRLVSGGGGGGLTMPFDSVTFNVNETDASLRELKYSEEKGYLQYGGQDSVQIPILPGIWYVRNDTSVTIPKGTVLRATGTLGASGRIKVKHMIANGSIDAMYILGIAMHDIAVGADGYAMSQGKIRQVNTQAYSEGAVLYADVDTLGGLTQTEPGNGYLKLPIAFVVHSASNGVLAVRITSGAYMRDLHDVDTTGRVDGSVLRYDSTAGYWKASTTAGIVAGDTAAMLTNYINVVDTAAMLTNYINIADTATMLSSYISNADTSVFARDWQIAGTTNRLAKFTGTSSLGDSPIVLTGDTLITFGTAAPGLVTINTKDFPNTPTDMPYTKFKLNNGYGVSGIYMGDPTGPLSASGMAIQLTAWDGSSTPPSYLDYYSARLRMSGTGDFYIDNSTASANGNGSMTTRFTINNAGNVGIATASPSRPLHVAGTTAIRIPVGTTAQQSTSANGDIRYNTDKANFEWYSGAGWREPVNAARKPADFTANRFAKFNTDGLLDTSAVLIQNGSNIGIGTASATNLLTIKSQSTSDIPVSVRSSAASNINIVALSESNGAGAISLKDKNGNTDIVLNTDITAFNISNDTTPPYIIATSYSPTSGNGPEINLSRARGTEASPSAVSNGDELGEINFSGRSTSGGQTTAAIRALADSVVTSRLNTGLAFYTGATTATLTERMRITSTGNVEIGTASPTAKLTIRDNTPGVPAQLEISNSNANSRALSMARNNTGNSIGFQMGGSNYILANRADFYTQGASVVGFYLATNGETPTGGNTPIYIQPGGYFNTPTLMARPGNPGEVSVGGVADNGAYNLQCNGTGVWGAGAYVNGSDARIKENIEEIGSSLPLVMNLRPVTFNYIESFSKDRTTQPGFIAQDLQNVFHGKNYANGIVMQGPEYLSVAYQNLVPLLTKAIQEQQAQIEALKKEIEALKNK